MSMYLPTAFEQTDRQTTVRFMRDNAFALVITTIGDGPLISHVPLLVSDDGLILKGHFARANPHHLHICDNPSVVVFQGPHCYVSPRWYEGPGVPTWNYMTVHAGISGGRILEDAGSRREVLAGLTEVYEAGRPAPWSIDELDEAFVVANLKALVAFELEVSSLTAKFKLSQNRPETDRRRVITELYAGSSGDREVARVMAGSGQ